MNKMSGKELIAIILVILVIAAFIGLNIAFGGIATVGASGGFRCH